MTQAKTNPWAIKPIDLTGLNPQYVQDFRALIAGVIEKGESFDTLKKSAQQLFCRYHPNYQETQPPAHCPAPHFPLPT